VTSGERKIRKKKITQRRRERRGFAEKKRHNTERAQRKRGEFTEKSEEPMPGK